MTRLTQVKQVSVLRRKVIWHLGNPGPTWPCSYLDKFGEMSLSHKQVGPCSGHRRVLNNQTVRLEGRSGGQQPAAALCGPFIRFPLKQHLHKGAIGALTERHTKAARNDNTLGSVVQSPVSLIQDQRNSSSFFHITAFILTSEPANRMNLYENKPGPFVQF